MGSGIISRKVTSEEKNKLLALKLQNSVTESF
jgi:hypothetical protein